jgi:hypothetical protein
LKGWCFAVAAEFQQGSLAALAGISGENFKQCFQQWEGRWDPYVQSRGDAFKGD